MSTAQSQWAARTCRAVGSQVSELTLCWTVTAAPAPCSTGWEAAVGKGLVNHAQLTHNPAGREQLAEPVPLRSLLTCLTPQS